MYIILTLLITCAVLGHALLCPSGNLLQNGGFEAYPNSVMPWSNIGRVAKILRPGHHSKQSAGISSTKFPSAELTQDFRACLNVSTYLFEADHFFNSPVFGKYTAGSILGSVGNLDIDFHASRKDNYTWTTNTQLIEAKPGRRNGVDLSLYNTYKGGETAIDNVKVTAVGDIVAKPGSKNLVKNPGFESATLAPWHGGIDACALVSPGAYGESGQAVDCTRIARLIQMVDTIPGQIYQFTFDLKFQLLNRNAGSEEQVCYTSFHIDNVYQFAGPYFLSPFRNNDTWFQIQQPIYANSKRTKISFVVNSNYGPEDGSCQYFFDNVSLKEAKKADS